jgi:hypothetical protein
MLYARLLIHPFCQLLESHQVYTVGPKRVKKEFRTSRLGIQGWQAESIEGFIEDQAFSPSYDLALPLPLSSSSKGVTQEDGERETIC